MSTVDPHSGHVHSDAEMPKVHEVPAAEPTAIDPVCGMTVSLKPDKDAAIVDVGAGSSRLVDCLLEQGFRRITVLDLSETALAKARSRQSQDASVEWVVANVLRWQPSGRFDVWHDRAAFHFLTEASDQDAYLRVMDRALVPGGHAIIGTFASDGPTSCSGLLVARYDATLLSERLGSTYRLVRSLSHEHRTPWGSVQQFHFGLFRKV